MLCTAPITPMIDIVLVLLLLSNRPWTITEPQLQAIVIDLLKSFGRISFCAVFCPPGHCHSWPAEELRRLWALWAAALLLEIIGMHSLLN